MVADPTVEPQRISDSPTDTRLEWPEQLPDDRFPGNIQAYPYIMIGWGDARFYRRKTHMGCDSKPGTNPTALFGSGQALMHVHRLPSLLRSEETGAAQRRVFGGSGICPKSFPERF